MTALAYGLSRSLGELADIFSVTGLVAVVAVAWPEWRSSSGATIAQEKRRRSSARGAGCADAPMAGTGHVRSTGGRAGERGDGRADEAMRGRAAAAGQHDVPRAGRRTVRGTGR